MSALWYVAMCALVIGIGLMFGALGGLWRWRWWFLGLALTLSAAIAGWSGV